MEFVETPVFSRQIEKLLPPENYHAMQLALVANPERGNVIRGSGGIRKMRWTKPGHGKSGGIRTI